MAAKKTKTLKAPDKADPGSQPDIWSRSTGSDSQSIRMARIGEIMSVLWMSEGAPKEEREKKILAALHMFSEIRPENGLEGMLATQMVATHSAAMECLRRAALPGQTFEGREQSIKHANKLMQIFTRQMEVLDKHRGKGQQKITVEHVTVEAGGQAIVGNVTAGAARSTGPQPPQALTDQSGNEILMPAPRVTEKAKASRRKAPDTDG